MTPRKGVPIMADLRADVAAARHNMRVVYGSRREIRRLSNYLREDETVEAMVAGRYEEGRGLIVLTNRRVLFLHDSIFSRTSQDFAAHTVSSVEWHSRMFFGDLIIFGDGSEARITGVWSGDGQKIADLIRRRIGRPMEVTQARDPQQVQPPSGSMPTMGEETRSQEDLLAQLERLNRLHQGGAISNTEYVQFKKKLLN